MQPYSKSFSIAVTIFALTTSTFAASLSRDSANNFSPYADLTINAYWDSQYQDMEPMNLLKVSQSSGIQNYHLAFITDAGSCAPAWGGQSTYSASTGWGSHLTDQLRTNNINYVISFGGASGNDLSLSCSNSQLVSAYTEIIQAYQPQGLDFDIENGTANVDKMMTALQQIQNAHPTLKISFTLPVMPEGLTAEGQEIINQAKANNLNYTVNIMAMDYGPAYLNDMGQYAIQAASNVFSFLKSLYSEKSDAALWQMIEVTPMIGVNDVNVEQFTLLNADTLRNFANQNHLGGLSIWSVPRDNPCSDKWASPTCSGNNLQSQLYEFSQHFMHQNNK